MSRVQLGALILGPRPILDAVQPAAAESVLDTLDTPAVMRTPETLPVALDVASEALAR